jgi:hypothetical protein
LAVSRLDIRLGPVTGNIGQPRVGAAADARRKRGYRN